MKMADKNHQKIERKIIQEVVKILVEKAQPDLIIQFGSSLSRDFGADSDLDLIIIEAKSPQLPDNRVEALYQLYLSLSQIPLAKDLLLYSREEFERFKDSKNHIISQALKKGKILYGRL